MTQLLMPILLLLLPLAGAAPARGNECRVRLALHGADGSKKTIRILSFELAENGRSRDRIPAARSRGPWEGSEVSFPRDWVGRSAVVAYLPLEPPSPRGPRPANVLGLKLSSCRLFHSIRLGELEEGPGDSSGVTVEGSVTGCSPDDEWWVRASAMFGESPVFEGQLDLTRRSFSLYVDRGARYVLVFGKGIRILKVTGIDIVAGRRNVLPPINLRERCE